MLLPSFSGLGTDGFRRIVFGGFAHEARRKGRQTGFVFRFADLARFYIQRNVGHRNFGIARADGLQAVRERGVPEFGHFYHGVGARGGTLFAVEIVLCLLRISGFGIPKCRF